MDNASVILTTFDRHLDHEASLIVYGRAAIQLGFETPPAEVARSLDVDGLIPEGEVSALVADDNFWDAQIATNEELRPRGLYITHLFQSNQVSCATTGWSIWSRSPGPEPSISSSQR
jgi:hypothetical protein